MSSYKSIVILTGAGISAESGIATFRDKGGLWENVNIEDVATPQAFRKDPARVHAFYNGRRAGLAGVKPNAAHFALARLEQEFDGDLVVVTQNIDDLHERAGSEKLIHMHGELNSVLCTMCEQRSAWSGDTTAASACPACGSVGHVRPDIVWFGEMPYHMNAIYRALTRCDLFISIGTSGNVYPAAGFVEEVRRKAHTVELNLEPSEGASMFAEVHQGPATTVVGEYVNALLAGH